jgi:hypothetical protein
MYTKTFALIEQYTDLSVMTEHLEVLTSSLFIPIELFQISLALRIVRAVDDVLPLRQQLIRAH